MKELTVSDAMDLVRIEAAPAISIYVGTNVNELGDGSKLAANLQRLYRTAEALVSRTHDAKTRERLLQPLKKALSALRLTRSKGGIAIFHSEKVTGILRLPTSTSDLAVAADSFHLKPVLRCMQLRRSHYILAFRKNRADLILVTADGTQSLERIQMSGSHERLAPDHEKSKRFFEGGIKFRRQKDLRESMLALHRLLERHFQNDRLPLLLAGPQRYQEAFRTNGSNVNLVGRGMVGHIEDIDTKALAGMSEGIMQQYFSALDNQVLVAFHKANASGLASTDLKEIADAAARGQVLSLLIAEDRNVWGHLDRKTGHVRVLDQRTDATADDLLDDIAELTLLKGGRVTVLPSAQMPEHKAIGAVLRWRDSSSPLLNGAALGAFARHPRRESRIVAVV